MSPRPAAPRALVDAAITAGVFALLAAAFFALLGRDPLEALSALAHAALGSSYAIGEAIVRSTPILLCALATLLPARLGLISVGAEGQLYAGAIGGTAVVLAWPDAPAATLLPAAYGAAMLAGAAWALLPALLRVLASVNETLSTLLLGYVAALAVTWLVYGAWKSPASQGWPATIEFPDAVKFAVWPDSRAHAGALVALAFAAAMHAMFTRTRWGLALSVLRSNARVAPLAGLSWSTYAIATMTAGGAIAGFAGMAETAMVQGRLQSDLGNGAGLSGFLVAWLAHGSVARAVPIALLVGALLSAGDGLQMTTGLASSATLVIQGLLFVAVLGVEGWRSRRDDTAAKAGVRS